LSRVLVFEKSRIFAQGLTCILQHAGHQTSVRSTLCLESLPWEPELFIADLDEWTGASDNFLSAAFDVAPVLFICGANNKDGGSRWPTPVHTVSRDIPPERLLESVAYATEAQGFGQPTARPGVSAGSTPGPDQSVLSVREREVLIRIADGQTYGQVARMLGISPHTVDTYVRRIRSKLNLGTKAELTRAALVNSHVGDNWCRCHV
jgi:DNA-binding CsgD family transcriptional regulator